MELHQRSAKGNLRITNTMARELPIPKDFDTFCWASQINQALAIRTAVEHWRRLKPYCMGALFWQIIDLWPAASWSSIDYYGRWKVLQHEAVRFFAPLLVSLEPENGKLNVWITSDLPDALSLTGELVVTPFFHAELSGTEGHFAGDWRVLRPGTHVLPYVFHHERATPTLTLAAARKRLSCFSFYDLSDHGSRPSKPQ